MKQTDIKKLFNRARRILKHPGLDLLVAPATETVTHLIIITPGRIGTAVERNTVRRRIKAIFHEEKLAQGLDCVIIVKKLGATLSHEQLKQILTNAFAQYST
jgi:ribonuclease P protein component